MQENFGNIGAVSMGGGRGGASVNTNGVSIYGENAVMVLSYYDSYVSVKMSPIKPEAERTLKSVYDYNKKLTIGISFDSVLYIDHALRDDVIPKTLKNENSGIGIKTGGSNIFMIGNGIKEFGEIKPYVLVCRGLNDQNKASESIAFQFKKQYCLKEYDPHTGDITTFEDNLYGLYVLQGFFRAASAICGAVGHAVRVANRTTDSYERQFRDAVAAKLGVVYDTPVNYINKGGSFGMGSYREGSAGNNFTPAPVIPTSTPVESSASFEDLGNLI